ncbi:MAG: hypothetical protein BWY79_00313 [Actinobacteria bacterium ADurb.Bin444]|nr:MAG: hypothetical protein BWY79_00313 [Actinobacteria bacterium ADurb.Bin444]
MSFVHVTGRGPIAQGAQRPHATDPQHDLLANPVFGAAAVQLVGDVLVHGQVLGDVGVKQDERHSPHLRPPHGHADPSAGQIDLHPHRLAILPHCRQHREGPEILGVVDFELPAVGVQTLREVPLLVEQTDSHQG